MMNNYEIYVCDTETTGLLVPTHDVIELSLLRLSTGNQQTWWLKPINTENIEAAALRVNGHKLEDLLHKTASGREKYKNPNTIIVEVENWLAEDNMPTEKRILLGQNSSFDKLMLEHLWSKCNASASFPFGRRLIDTISIELFIDYCKGAFAEGYSLNNLTKKYAVKNEKAHSAAADTKATKEVFEKQVEFFKKILGETS